MSTDHTGAASSPAFVAQGLSVHLLPTHRDVDEPADAAAAAAAAPAHQVRPHLPPDRRDTLPPRVSCSTPRCGARGVHVEGDAARASAAPQRLAVDSWLRMSAVDELIVSRCSGPVIDIGCGPGRFVEALAARGLPALGIDVSGASVGHTRARGASALCRNVFEPVPGEGRWQTLLLADGNVGIGGDPLVLLDRCRELLSPEGWALVEVDPDEDVDVRTRVTLTGPLGRRSTPFPWALVGARALVRYAARGRPARRRGLARGGPRLRHPATGGLTPDRASPWRQRRVSAVRRISAAGAPVSAGCRRSPAAGQQQHHGQHGQARRTARPVGRLR